MNHYFPNMFKPIQIGTVTVPNRFVVPPMGNNFANTDGSMSDRSAAYYEARAKGGFGLITLESTVVYKEAKGGPRKPCLFDDAVIPSFKAVADRCHAYGAKVSIQLQHAGPEGNSKLTGYPLKAASAIAPSAGREIPEAMPTEEVYKLIECYGDAARRAQLAGIDMVEVHCAHGYLVSTFISARTNKRTDEFGGCFENRMRLPRLIIENIRKKTGGNMPILCRINCRDEGDGGVDVHDAAAIAAYLEQVCGVDAIHVTRSIHIHDEFMWAPNITHGGFNAELGTEIKRAVSVPVILVGRFTEPQYAELLVKEGRADLIAFGRQSIADPELPNKARNGQLEKLTPCIACLLGCVPNMLQGRPITCAMNPCVGRESELKPAEVKKNVVVIGGGPGGLEAARCAAERGCSVTLYEKGDRLGGTFLTIATGDFKWRIPQLIKWYEVQLKKLGVKVVLNTEIGVDDPVLESADAVFVATGSKPVMPAIPGIEKAIDVEQIHKNGMPEGKNVVICGGGLSACDTAIEYAAKGDRKFTIVEMLPQLASDVMVVNKISIDRLLNQHGVEQLVNTKVVGITDAGVEVESAEGKKVLPADVVIGAFGRARSLELADAIQNKYPMKTTIIGDCMKPAKAGSAIREGFYAAMALK